MPSSFAILVHGAGDGLNSPFSISPLDPPRAQGFLSLGEMPAAQLRETTMDASRRSIARVTVPLADATAQEMKRTATLVEDLMGRKPKKRLAFIQKNAHAAGDLDV